MTLQNTVVPETPVLTKQSYSAPMSFVGATRRIVPWILTGNSYVNVALWMLVIPVVLTVVYAVVLTWYVLIFVVFGLFVIPWKLHRRNERKRIQVQQAQLAALQALTR